MTCPEKVSIALTGNPGKRLVTFWSSSKDGGIAATTGGEMFRGGLRNGEEKSSIRHWYILSFCSLSVQERNLWENTDGNWLVSSLIRNEGGFGYS